MINYLDINSTTYGIIFTNLLLLCSPVRSLLRRRLLSVDSEIIDPSQLSCDTSEILYVTEPVPYLLNKNLPTLVIIQAIDII